VFPPKEANKESAKKEGEKQSFAGVSGLNAKKQYFLNNKINAKKHCP